MSLRPALGQHARRCHEWRGCFVCCLPGFAKGPTKAAFWQKYQRDLKYAASKATVIDAEAA